MTLLYHNLIRERKGEEGEIFHFYLVHLTARNNFAIFPHMLHKLILVVLLLNWAETTAAEVISISSLKRSETYSFSPDFTKLAYYTRKCEVSGWEPKTQLFLVTGGAEETNLNVNAGTTQYQGHYVWLTNKVVSGFGTYTSSKKNRSFGWIFRNDTGKELTITGLSTVFGQWGAKNTRPDTLSFECRVSEHFVDPTAGDGWLQSDTDIFTTPFTNNAPGATFPIFEHRILTTRPERIRNGDYFAVRFTDTCPSAGNNAHLGIADFKIVFASRQKGFQVLFY